jgi:hypothetical protein
VINAHQWSNFSDSDNIMGQSANYPPRSLRQEVSYILPNDEKCKKLTQKFRQVRICGAIADQSVRARSEWTIGRCRVLTDTARYPPPADTNYLPTLLDLHMRAIMFLESIVMKIKTFKRPGCRWILCA